MNNLEFINHIRENNPMMLKEDVMKMLQFVYSAMREVVLLGESLNVPGFGTFRPEHVDQKGTWKSPSGQMVELKPKVRLRFKASKQIEKFLTARLLDEQD